MAPSRARTRATLKTTQLKPFVVPERTGESLGADSSSNLHSGCVGNHQNEQIELLNHEAKRNHRDSRTDPGKEGALVGRMFREVAYHNGL